MEIILAIRARYGTDFIIDVSKVFVLKIILCLIHDITIQSAQPYAARFWFLSRSRIIVE